MVKHFLNGAVTGAGIVVVLAVAFLVAWAGDVFTIDKDGTPKFAVSDAGKITVGATESYVNLVVQNNGAAPTNKVDITADVLTVEGVRLENLNVSADITAAVGAGGRDTNFPDATGWYYIWVITNNTGTLVNGILTLAPATPNPPTPPTLPSGYTKYRRVGAVRNDGSGNFLRFVQEGNRVNYGAGESHLVLTNGTATGWTTVSCATYVPPTSRTATIWHRALVGASVPNVSFDAHLRPTGTTVRQARLQQRTQVANQYIMASGFHEISLDNSQQLDYKVDVETLTNYVYITVFGYHDRI